jgi:hypothetical protein
MADQRFVTFARKPNFYAYYANSTEKPQEADRDTVCVLAWKAYKGDLLRLLRYYAETGSSRRAKSKCEVSEEIGTRARGCTRRNFRRFEVHGGYTARALDGYWRGAGRGV